MNNSIKVIHKQKDYYLDIRERIKEYQLKSQDKFMARKKFNLTLGKNQLLIFV